jgi:hypothetical protein
MEVEVDIGSIRDVELQRTIEEPLVYKV